MMLTVTETQIVIALALMAVHFVLREALFERATVRTSDLSFSPVLGLRLIFWFGVPACVFAAYKVFGEIESKFDWLYPCLFLGFACLIFFSYPGTIQLNSNGIGLRRYLGLRVKRLKWDDVASVVSSRVLRTISVYEHHGTSIVHTQFHVDPSRFKSELRRRLSVPIIEE